MNKAPFYTKFSDDGFMWAEVHNLSDVKLYFLNGYGIKIKVVRMSEAEREFCEQARQEAIKEMLEVI